MFKELKWLDRGHTFLDHIMMLNEEIRQQGYERLHFEVSHIKIQKLQYVYDLHLTIVIGT